MSTVCGRAVVAELYETHFNAVFRLCRSMLGNQDEAADAAHDVFARAVHGSRTWDSGEHARAWLLSVARHRCIDLLRRRERFSQAMVRVRADSDQGQDPESVALNRDLVKSVLAGLSPRERLMLWQSAVESRSLGDIAAHLQVNYQAAAQALHRARRRAGTIAARIAVVIALIRLTRPLRRLSPALATAPQALLLALVPLIVVSTQSSASIRPSLSNGHPLAAQLARQKHSHHHPSAPPVAVQPGVPASATSTAYTVGSPLPAPSATLSTALGGVNQTLSQIPDSGPIWALAKSVAPTSPSAPIPIPIPIPTPTGLPTP